MDSGSIQQSDDEQEPVLNLDLRRYLLALRRYAWLVAALVALAITGAVVYTTQQTPVYEATASVQIDPRVPDLLGTGDLFNVAAGNNTGEYYKQQRQLLGSYPLIRLTVETQDLVRKLLSDQEIRDLTTEAQIDRATRRLKEQIKITYPEQDRTMYVAVRNVDPKLAQLIATEHVKTYEAYAKGRLSVNTSKASKALEGEFVDAETKLRAAEDKIAKFQTENDMLTVRLEEHQTMISTNIVNFTQKFNDARAKEIEIAARLTEMKKQATQDVLSSPILMMGEKASFESIRSQYYTEKIRLLELKKNLAEKHPDFIAQSQKVDELYKGLQGEVQIIVNGTQDLHTAAVVTSRALAAEVDRFKKEAQSFSPKVAEYNDLLRTKKDSEDKYNILRARLSTTQLTGGISNLMSNVHPLDPAFEPTTPVSPNMRINVMLASVLGLVLGIGVVLLIVFLDRSIKSAADAAQAAGAPVLGIIPSLSTVDLENDDDRTRDLYVFKNPTSHVAECCRSLRTNIMFSAADQQMKTLVVCSANPREGKTTTVIYLGTTLAQSMAESGQKVLLVDTDMRRPRLHASTGVPRQLGLSNLLIGEQDYDSVIKTTEIPNLYVLPCGPLPPNPAELLMTKRFETVLDELRKRFSHIILDSPPLPYTDAVVLSKRTDGVILVVRAGKTVRDDLARSAKTIRDVGGAVVGVIVNELERTRADGYYYGYYGYGGVDQERSAEPA